MDSTPQTEGNGGQPLHKKQKHGGHSYSLASERHSHLSWRHHGGWLPKHHGHMEEWLQGFKAESKAVLKRSGQQLDEHLLPSTSKLQELLDTDPIVRMLMEEMVSQEPEHKHYKQRPFENVHELLLMINRVLRVAPDWNETGLVGCPLNAILDWCMATQAGYAFFRNEKVNKVIALLLTDWCQYLCSAESLYVVNKKDGWLCDVAKEKLHLEEVDYNESSETGGFKSWNDFFTRPFKEGKRPVEDPDNDKVIVSACESTPFRISTSVAIQDRFWVKGQPYSLRDMLANDEHTDQFVGGSIYQAFLSALNYHRWHSPVNGTIVKTRHVPGTYYSEAESQGFDPSGPDLSQGYISHVAARLLIFIQANDPAIGLMAVMMVGMGEVSSCKLLDKIKPGYKVNKGEEIGCFQYGGSTHCLFFRKGVIQAFALQAIPGSGQLVHLKTKIAVAN